MGVIEIAVDDHEETLERLRIELEDIKKRTFLVWFWILAGLCFIYFCIYQRDRDDEYQAKRLIRMVKILKTSGIDDYALRKNEKEPIGVAIQELIGVPMSHILEASDEEFKKYLDDIHSPSFVKPIVFDHDGHEH